MDPGLYIAASGMLAEQVRQTQLANNLANASTPGYEPQEAVQSSFGALLLANSATGQTIGTLDTGVRISATVTDANPTPLQSTGQPLDFGIAGSGYFAVRTSAGVRYTRDGRFQESSAGQLTDQNGNPVLSQSGQPIAVDSQGRVSPTALGVFNVPNATPQGDNLLAGTATGRATGTVRQGELNESGVDPIQTMTDMIASLRAYQAGQSAIQSIDQTMQEDATSVPSI
ncbi:MAG TPA: flagellar hook-basal body protein [Solirubrobacteraceae bacterium]|nr:flagellar hook-basal body protein [Solirubrobacteraceae bacterium]